MRSDGRKTLSAPGHRRFRCIPGIMNRAEREPFLRIEVVIQPDQIFPPVRGLSNRARVNRTRATAKIRLWNHLHQKLRVLINRRQRIIWIRISSVRIERAIASIRRVAHIVEVTLPVRHRRNEAVEILRNVFPAPVLKPEEKCMVLPHRTAHAKSEIVLLVAGLGSTRHVEIVVRVEGFVAGKLP